MLKTIKIFLARKFGLNIQIPRPVYKSLYEQTFEYPRKLKQTEMLLSSKDKEIIDWFIHKTDEVALSEYKDSNDRVGKILNNFIKDLAKMELTSFHDKDIAEQSEYLQGATRRLYQDLISLGGTKEDFGKLLQSLSQIVSYVGQLKYDIVENEERFYAAFIGENEMSNVPIQKILDLTRDKRTTPMLVSDLEK